MWTQTNQIIDGEEQLRMLLTQGRFQEAVDYSIDRLRKDPEFLPAIETLMKAQWKTGDNKGALKSIRLAMKLNPHEPGYRLLRGLVYQSLGMIAEAMADFVSAIRTESGAVAQTAQQAIYSLENWQLQVLEVLLAEDRLLLMEFRRDAAGFLNKRGFALSKRAVHALAAISENTDFSRNCYSASVPS